MPTRTLGASGPRVSTIGLGCMAMAGVYGASDDAESIATIHAALDAGINLIDTGDFYGMGRNELLLRQALRDHAVVPRDRRDLVTPLVPMLRPAVEHQHGVRFGRSRLGHVHGEAARVDVAVGDAFDFGERAGHGLRSLTRGRG